MNHAQGIDLIKLNLQSQDKGHLKSPLSRLCIGAVYE
jgi:hypothetical protein